MKKLDLICGLCVLESEELALEVAQRIIEAIEPFKEKVNFTFKGSFDKANRSSFDSYRGPGLEKGLKILEKVKSTYDVPTLTDIHLPDQCEPVAAVVDIIQVPAFLCRQTDLIVSAAKACQKYDRKLNVKKGQFLSAEEAKNIVKKVDGFLPIDSLMLTERGTSFGYNNLVVDMSSFSIMKSFGVKVIHDATHCVQRPGGLGKSTGGKREQIEVLARAAIAAGADGIFMETHPTPDKALSDPATCLDLNKVRSVVGKLLKIKEVVNEFN
jgi:2-dehydro-3-deoxyphosphooctonate aldolase (KDO 8-P synthase)